MRGWSARQRPVEDSRDHACGNAPVFHIILRQRAVADGQDVDAARHRFCGANIKAPLAFDHFHLHSPSMVAAQVTLSPLMFHCLGLTARNAFFTRRYRVAAIVGQAGRTFCVSPFVRCYRSVRSFHYRVYAVLIYTPFPFKGSVRRCHSNSL